MLSDVDLKSWGRSLEGHGLRVSYHDPPYVPPPGGRKVTGYGPADPAWERMLEDIVRSRAASDITAVSHSHELAEYLEGDWWGYDVTPWGSGKKPETLTLSQPAPDWWVDQLRLAHGTAGRGRASLRQTALPLEVAS